MRFHRMIRQYDVVSFYQKFFQAYFFLHQDISLICSMQICIMLNCKKDDIPYIDNILPIVAVSNVEKHLLFGSLSYKETNVVELLLLGYVQLLFLFHLKILL